MLGGAGFDGEVDLAAFQHQDLAHSGQPRAEGGDGASQSAGETLHPGVEPLFKQLGLWDEIMRAGFHRHRGVWKRQVARRNFEPYGEDPQED